MEIIDKQFLETPWYGSRQMARFMRRQGHKYGRHRVRRLMRLMGLVPISQEADTRKKYPQHRIRSYLSRNMVIDRRTRSGVQTLPASQCGADSFTLSLSWTGTAARCWPGDCQTVWGILCRNGLVMHNCNHSDYARHRTHNQ